MKKAATVLLAAAMLVGLASDAHATPTTNRSSSVGVESAFGLESDGVWLSTYSLAYDVQENGVTSKIVVPMVFVDGENLSMECWAYTDEGDVSIDPQLAAGSYSATIEGSCFDFITEQSVPFSIDLAIDAVGTGVTDIRGGSYVDDGNRCVSQRRSREGTATGTLSVQIPDRGIDATGEVSDSFTSLVGFSQHCHAMNGQIPGHDHEH